MVVASIALFLLELSPSRAQEPDLLTAYRQTLARPTDYDAAYALAQRAARAGDYELAIQTLERLLAYNPGLTRARFELGVNYFRLGSYEMALYHFRELLAGGALDADLRRRVESYVPFAEKMRQASRFTVYAQAGLRHQTNAGFVPDGDLVRLGGVDLLLSGPVTRKADWSAFGLVSVGHDYDFQNQRGDVLETRATGFASEKFRLSAYDVGLLDVSIGPRFGLGLAGMPGASIKPYLAGGVASVGNSYYASGAGAGLDAIFPVTRALTLEPNVEWRNVYVRNSSNLPSSTLSTGDYLTASLAADLRITDSVSVQTRGAYRHAEARRASQSYDEASIEAAVKVDFDPPFEAIPRRWSVSPFVKLASFDFRRPDPIVDPNVTRRDRSVTLGAMLDAAITANLGIGTSLQWARINSNLPNYRIRDVSVTFGPTLRY